MPKARFHRGYWSTLSRRKPRTAAAGLGRACLILAVLMLVGGLATACAGGDESAPTQSATVGPEGISVPCLALNGLNTYRYSVQLEVESPEPTESAPEPTEGAAEPTESAAEPTESAAEPTESAAGPTVTPTTTFTRPYTGDFVFDYRISADFVAPDRTQAVIASGESELPMIIIGQDSWVRLGESGWTQPQYPAPLPYQPADVCQAVFPELDLSSVAAQEEEANDVKALRYTFSQVPAGQAMAKIFGPESDMALLISKLDADVWLAKKDGWPVRMEISAGGVYGDGRELRVHLLIDVKDANSGDIKVEPPA